MTTPQDRARLITDKEYWDRPEVKRGFDAEQFADLARGWIEAEKGVDNGVAWKWLKQIYADGRLQKSDVAGLIRKGCTPPPEAMLMIADILVDKGIPQNSGRLSLPTMQKNIVAYEVAALEHFITKPERMPECWGSWTRETVLQAHQKSEFKNRPRETAVSQAKKFVAAEYGITSRTLNTWLKGSCLQEWQKLIKTN